VTERAPSGERVYRLRLRMHASEALRRTPLHDRHLAAGARMVPFAGWEMPVQYEGVIPEHRAVREHAGVFDVSHMGQLEVRGPAAVAYLQTMLSNDLSRIGMGQAQYTLLLDENGCPIDDLIAYRLDDDHLLLVVNASRVDADRDWLAARARDDAVLDDRSAEMAMLALQGPAALDLVELPRLEPFEFTRAEVCGVLGIAAGAVPAGLGARDTLRLEVCYPLYGNDLSQNRTALEAGLGWVCALDRKEFVGAPALRAQRERGGYDRLVAFRMSERGIPRQGMAVRPAGEVTSGTMSPSLEVGIGMGYVPADLAAEGTEIEIDVRGRPVAARVAAKPLYVKEKVK
jgi:aminomethyltransferase